MINEVDQKLDTYFLYPAALFVSKKPHIITTILGSCVAVCLFDPILGFGGINHFMLPLWNGQGLASPRYGNIAISRLIDKMVGFGSKQENLVAKVFGGSEVIKTNSTHYHIGENNIKIALSLLNENKIQIAAKSIGGKKGRKITFQTNTGLVKLKYIENNFLS